MLPAQKTTAKKKLILNLTLVGVSGIIGIAVILFNALTYKALWPYFVLATASVACSIGALFWLYYDQKKSEAKRGSHINPSNPDSGGL